MKNPVLAALGTLLAITSVATAQGKLDAASASLSGPVANVQGALSGTVETNFAAAGRAVFDFSVTNPGSYVLLATVDAPGTKANAFWVNVDAEPEENTMLWEIPATHGFEQRVVGWKGAPVTGPGNRKSFKLQAGKHRFFIRAGQPHTRLASVSVLQLPDPPVLKIVGTGR